MLPKKKRTKLVEYKIKKCFNALRDNLFSSEEEFIGYVNSMKDPKDAELFLDLCEFYSTFKELKGYPYIKLIAIISIIDKLNARKVKFKPFKDWVLSKEGGNYIKEYLSKVSVNDEVKKFKEVFKKLREKHGEIFGSQRSVIKFFENYCSVNDQVKLIRAFKFKRTAVVERYSQNYTWCPSDVRSIEDLQKKYRNQYKVEKRYMPECYDWRYCWVEGRTCNSSKCRLIENHHYRKEILGKIVSFIYQMRNDFIHGAKIPPIIKRPQEVDTLTIAGKIGDEYGIINLSIEDIQEIFERGFKKYFDKLSTEPLIK